jgi:uncharacterized membrane protein
MNNRLKRFIQLQSVLAACCIFCLALLAGRIKLSGNIAYIFMAWNLFLACVPMAFAILLRYFTPKSNALCAGLFVLWLLFFPNATYMISDLLHLTHLRSALIPGWYDAIMLFFYALTGLFLGLVSLNYVHVYLKSVFSVKWSWIIVSCSILLSGFGVYLGRFLRWNSWDIIRHPFGLFQDITERITHPIVHFQTYIVTFVFTVILFFAYLLFDLSKEREPS